MTRLSVSDVRQRLSRCHILFQPSYPPPPGPAVRYAFPSLPARYPCRESRAGNSVPAAAAENASHVRGKPTGNVFCDRNDGKNRVRIFQTQNAAEPLAFDKPSRRRRSFRGGLYYYYEPRAFSARRRIRPKKPACAAALRKPPAMRSAVGMSRHGT